MRVLTKSRFKLGLECPNKLFYTSKKEYANEKVSDPFLEALAQGGFQVEELARMHYPDGILIEGNDGDYELLWHQTQELLQQESVIIFEAAFLYNGLFIKTDILIKRGNKIELIEVKSKSFDPSNDNLFVGKRGGLVSGWKPYLFDIAFQKYVIQMCFPLWEIATFIMMADKTKQATIDGLNQSFRITQTAENRTGIKKLVQSIDELGESVLNRLNISEIINDIINNKYPHYPNLTFIQTVDLFKENYSNDTYINWPTSFGSCKSCEFKATPEEEKNGLLSGYKECFKKQHNWSYNEFNKPNIFEIWFFGKGAKLFDQGIYFMDELTPDLIGYKETSGKLTTSERQWLQIEKEVNSDNEIYVDIDGLRKEIETYKYPLHFIDFETSAVALPFNKGRRPYEQIAFQFSHHMYFEDGTIEHATEYINNKAGFFPNFDFIRNLKRALENDQGSIFRYSHHENTILNAIHEQLLDSNEADKEHLILFIKTISHSKNGSAIHWKGERDMIDLWEMVKNYYYNPLTRGSNSIKEVLPSALSKSAFLMNKYSQKLEAIRVTSRNFPKEHIWLLIENGQVINPYKMLPPVFEDWSEDDIENTLSEIEDIANGGAALTAYGKLQYTDMSAEERTELTKALLKYCELDTLAMVMIFEHFKELSNYGK